MTQPSRWSVRPALEGDLDACVFLVMSHDGGLADDWRPRFEARLAANDGAIFVASAAEEVVAYGRVATQVDGGITAEPSLPDGLYLSGVVVAASSRRQGIALALCDARLRWARGRGSEVWFFTNVSNAASRALHKAAGFDEVRDFMSPDLDGGRGVLGRCSLADR